MDAALQTSEELREKLLALHREHDGLLESSRHTSQLLEALESLLDTDVNDDPFVRVFILLHKMFTFSQALVLTESRTSAAAAALSCVLADPAGLVGSRWPAGSLFQKVLKGRTVVTFTNANATEWEGAATLGLNPADSALYVPIRSREQRGILMLVEPSQGKPAFDQGHVALARRFSTLISHALATRAANQGTIERRNLRRLSEQLQQSEQAAKRNADLLNEMVQLMPVGVTVQNDGGRVLIINGTAANLLAPPDKTVSPPQEQQAQQKQQQKPAPQEKRAWAVPEWNKRDLGERLQDGVEYTRERVADVNDEARTILVTSKSIDIFDERLLLTTSMDITERKRMEDELQHRAFHDQLTQLPNRELIQKIVEGAVQSHRAGGQQFALTFIDLDNFKQVNDYYSHDVGDQLLVAVAHRITAAVRKTDTLARISGDEFLLLIDPLPDLMSLSRLVEYILAALKQPFFIENHELMTSASMGTSVFPLHGDNYEDLRRCADNAMYRAKTFRKGSVVHFDPAHIGNTLTARMELEQRLRIAIREQYFRAAYQPKVKLATREVSGFEALIRWVDPDGRIYLPGMFIEMASELGLLDGITMFMLEEIARDLPALSERFGSDIRVSLNVSALQAGDPDFMNRLLDRIAELGVARQLILELTEDALIAAHSFQHNVLPHLRSLGGRVSIDDFGTGYSSLSMLSDITADELKIDRSFITTIHKRPRSQSILKAIESLCRVFQISTVAEGAETEEEINYLRSFTSVHLVQGFYFSRPLFLEAVLKLHI